MRCPRCGQENPSRAKFCLECATSLPRVCAQCRSALPTTAKFCPECAHPVAPTASAGAGTGEARPRFSSPEAYTPKHLAERILTSKSGLEGERKLVTVLFADLKGSMELLADRDPEDARSLLDPVLEQMMEAVHRYEGTVNQVMGDGIMALFGAPLAHEDHAVRACYAALRMQGSVGRHAEEVRRSHGVPLQIRVGLNSGEVVVRSIGNDLHMDYTAVGQTTHLAARMEQMAMAGSTLMTASTLRLAEGYVEVTPLGSLPVRGLSEPVEVYELTRARPAPTRFQASAARGLTRFVGRDAEMEQLRRALEQAGQGHGQVATVAGEPGVGKSRLYHEFAHSHRTRGWLVLVAGSVSYGKATSYLPVIDLLKGYFKIHGRDDQREIREKVTGRILTLDRVFEPVLPAFLALLDVPVDNPEWERLDPFQRRQRTIDGVKRLLLRESQVQPLLLVFEDLHWIDTETQALLDGLIDSLPAARILLLLNFRPEYERRFASKSYVHQLRLNSLEPASAGDLLRGLLGAEAELAPLAGALIRRTEGNPFFLEESVRTLVETGALAGERGAYRLTRPVQAIQVPATVQVVLAARIDRLPAEDKRLLQAASVVGKDVPLALLQAVAEVPEEALRHGLAHLQAAEFLYETSLFPEPEYTFKHALTHEVAYGSVLQERRRTLHGRIVEVMETLYADRRAEHIERLAHHALRGERWGHAVQYSREAGAKAFDRSANREAVAHHEQALVALAHLPESREHIETAIDVRFDLRVARLPLGENTEIQRHIQEAAVLAERLGDRQRQGWASAYMTSVFQLIGDLPTAIAAGERALARAREDGDLDLMVATNFCLAQIHLTQGEWRRAAGLFEDILASIRDRPSDQRYRLAGPPSVLCRADLARARAMLGEFDAGIRVGEEAVRLAESLRSTFSLVYAYGSGMGPLHAIRGDHDEAIAALERARLLAETANFAHLLRVLLVWLGDVYVMSGRASEAVPLLERARDISISSGILNLGSWQYVGLGEAHLEGGRHEEAEGHARSALERALEHRNRCGEALAARLFGEIASRGHRATTSAALGHYARALALGEDLGMRPFVGRCHLNLGEHYRRVGDDAKAAESLAAAATLFRDMGMASWLEKVEAAG